MADRQDACLYVPRLWRELPNKASIEWQSQHTFVPCGVKVSKFLACESAARGLVETQTLERRGCARLACENESESRMSADAGTNVLLYTIDPRRRRVGLNHDKQPLCYLHWLSVS